MPQIVCPNGHRLQITDRHIGQVINCPTCQVSFTAQAVPETATTAALPPEGPGASPLATGQTGGFLGGLGPVGLINRFLGRPLLFFGLILVVLGRGCDATGMRSVSRTNAYYRLVRDTHKLESDSKISVVQQKVDKKTREISETQDSLNEKPGDAKIQESLNTLRKEQISLNKELNKARHDETSAMTEKENGEWKPLREAALKAASSHQMSVYWYQWIFIFGTIVLVLGILTLAFTGEGAERWIAYIMIAIITFSIYVAGVAWVESIASSFGAQAFR